jgi:hypothetical protein
VWRWGGVEKRKESKEKMKRAEKGGDFVAHNAVFREGRWNGGGIEESEAKIMGGLGFSGFPVCEYCGCSP